MGLSEEYLKNIEPQLNYKVRWFSNLKDALEYFKENTTNIKMVNTKVNAKTKCNKNNKSTKLRNISATKIKNKIRKFVKCAATVRYQSGGTGFPPKTFCYRSKKKAIKKALEYRNLLWDIVKGPVAKAIEEKLHGIIRLTIIDRIVNKFKDIIAAICPKDIKSFDKILSFIKLLILSIIIAIGDKLDDLEKTIEDALNNIINNFNDFGFSF
jgi:hypothetical protein